MIRPRARITPRTLILGPSVLVVNFQASLAISSAVAGRVATFTPASRAARSRLLSSVYVTPSFTKVRIGSTFAGFTLPLARPSMRSPTGLPSLNVVPTYRMPDGSTRTAPGIAALAVVGASPKPMSAIRLMGTHVANSAPVTNVLPSAFTTGAASFTP